MRAHHALPERYNAARWFVGRHVEEGRGERTAIITDRERISYRVLDPTGADAAVDQVGDLLVRGDSALALYWNRHEASRHIVRGEWVWTGDTYRRDADGFYWYAGRSDELLKVGGIWISPTEIEATLAEHPAVLECAVVGREDDDGLVKPHALVVPRDGVAPTGLEATLQLHVRRRLADYKYPRWVTLVPELPRTTTGKIQRFRLREREPGA